MKRALVLSGGGAKGAFQFGALQYIHEHLESGDPAFRFDIIAGVSVGALNGVMLAMDKYDQLDHIWHTITKNQIYKGSLSPLSALFRIIFGKKGVLSNAPLYKMLERYVFLNEISPERDLRLGAVSLISGEYVALRAADMPDDTNLRRAVLASTAIPVIWAPVKFVRTRTDAFRQLVDGGVRNVSPLGDVIKENPDEVIIINCDPEAIRTDEHAAKNLFTIAMRSLADIAINEIFRSDVREFLRINDLVTQAEAQGITLTKPDGTPYVKYKSYFIEPREDIGDTLDFSRAILDQRISLGYATAREVFEA